MTTNTQQEKAILEENARIEKLFDLVEVLAFQLDHQVEITKESDSLYFCHIDEKCYGISLTLLGALVFGILQYNELKGVNQGA